MKSISPSVKAYFGLFVFVIVLRVLLFFVHVEYVLPAQEQMVSIPSLVVVFALGLIGLRLATKAGFTEMWDSGVDNRQRFLVPAIIGLGFGILSVIIDLLQPLGGEIQIKLPASLLVYPIGGILEEILFRLLLTTFLIWFFSKVLFRGRWGAQVFWVVAIAIGLLYSFLQIGQYSVLTGLPVDLLTFSRFLVIIGAYFVVAAYLFRKYGFLAAVSMRLADYLVFHILWGGLFLN
jgi:hypothetical protein